MRKAFIEALCGAAARDPSITLVTGDLGYNFFEPFIERFPDRFMNIGIMEQTMAGVCAGMALEGRKVFMYSIGNFATLRCLEQIRNDICYHGLDVKIVTNGAGMAYGYLGMTHHATEDLAAMRALPGMRVIVPADPAEAAAGVRYACATPGPVFLRMARGREAPLHSAPVDLAAAPVLTLAEGRDALILACGEIAHVALEAATLLRADGVEAGVCSCPVVSPFPAEAVAARVENARAVFTLEEHNLAGGFGSAALEALNDLPGCRVPKMHRLGLPNVYTCAVGKQDYLREVYGLSAAKIRDAVLRVVRG